jgi:hypothetical protein
MLPQHPPKHQSKEIATVRPKNSLQNTKETASIMSSDLFSQKITFIGKSPLNPPNSQIG